MITGHIVAKVRLASSPAVRNFAKSPIDSYPTILTVGKNSFSSQALLAAESLVKPGAVLKVSFRFLFPLEALAELKVGTEFIVWEQDHIGTGQVIEVT